MEELGIAEAARSERHLKINKNKASDFVAPSAEGYVVSEFFSNPAYLAPPSTHVALRSDGSFVMRSHDALQPYARCIGEWLERWATERPEHPFFGERRAGNWFMLTYREVREQIGSLAQGLLELGIDLADQRPILMLSDNDVNQALLSLAAMHVGMPVATVSVAYSQNISGGCHKLKAIVDVLQPAVIFVNDGEAFRRAIELVRPDCVIVACHRADAIVGALTLASLSKPEGPAVMSHFSRINSETPARYLLTSGSTGTPKAVVNTHGMLCANQQAIAQCWRFVEHSEMVVLDWLPWSHTFGANHNFNLVLRNGGTLYIDEGRPVPGLVERTVENIKSVKPTLFFNVPRGYEVLLPYLEKDEELAHALFGRLDLLFYAAAALPQSSWDRLIACADRVRRRPLFFSTEWGSTETSPVLTSVHFPQDRAGNIGLPVPGVEIKFVPCGDKLEMRARGPSVFTRYLDDPVKTAQAFDDEGFYMLGDAGRLADSLHPESGICFDGRVTEDFKLSSGTWVSVGTLRLNLISALAPYASDCIICGHDKDTPSALIYPTPALFELLGNEGKKISAGELAQKNTVRLALGMGLRNLAKNFPASSQHVERLIILDSPPNLELGEITDKGYINQRAALGLRATQVNQLYAAPLDAAVILLEVEASA